MNPPASRPLHRVLILNGPNLNQLGKREPEIYGSTTLATIETLCRKHAQTHGLTMTFQQSNHEGVLIDAIQNSSDEALIINAAALTHQSIALLDSLRAFTGFILEVHLSNIYKREPYRRHSYISEAADGLICGLGAQGYLLALDAVAHHLNESPKEKAHV
ncbi:MAG: type II 3-dehydroquinate dehydratase [Alphaproteobacteria bacterium GM202ARS2]|nr:type II 3-dehydroquinate dehydratase [Alphaproteobacteria bacterium GM202ARS2]